MVVVVWMSWCFARSSCWGVQILWFRVMMEILRGFFVASMMAQCMEYVVMRWFVGCGYLAPCHFEASAQPCEPKTVSLVCGKLYLFSRSGHVRGTSNLSGWVGRWLLRILWLLGVCFGVDRLVVCFWFFFLVVQWCIYWGAMRFWWQSLVGEVVRWLLVGWFGFPCDVPIAIWVVLGIL